MYDSRSILAQFLRSVDALVDGGGKVTETFTAIRSRYDQVDAMAETPAIVTLSNFVLEGPGRKKIDDASLEQLVTLSLAEITANSQARAELKQRIAGQVLASLRDEYKTNCAEVNLLRLGEYLANAAEALAQAVETIDPDTSVERIVSIEDNDQRTAWNKAPYLNNQVEETLKGLAAAAELLGIQPTKENLFHLVVDARDLDRKRPVWNVWDGQTGRGGRFADLLKLGAEITPIESLDDLQDRIARQGRPGPLETRYVREEFGVRPMTFDPDDPDFEDQLEAAGAFRAGNSL